MKTSNCEAKNQSNETNWHYLQIKGDIEQDQPKEEDIVSVVQFNHDGEYLATGDRGGRVVIFKRENLAKTSRDYSCYISFQSHEPVFDCLKSLDIDEGIIQIKWVKPISDSLLLLTTNTKTIKLWKITEKFVTDDCSEDQSDMMLHQNGVEHSQKGTNCSELDDDDIKASATTYSTQHRVRDSASKKVYDNVHAYTVNSISVSTDHENFISTDDLRIYLWNFHYTDICFKVVDIKPENMEDLTDVITCSAFHPIHSSLLVYGVSRGVLNMCDLREKAVFTQPSLIYDNYYAPHTIHYEFQNEMKDMLNSFGDVRFSSDGMLLMARDYLGVRIWDQRMSKRPLEVYPVQSFLKSHMETIYEGCLFLHRFDCAWSPDNKSILTGSYSDIFTIIPREATSNGSSHDNRAIGSGIVNSYSDTSEQSSNDFVLPSIDTLSEFHNYYYQASLSDFCMRSSLRLTDPINRKLILLTDDLDDAQSSAIPWQDTPPTEENGMENDIKELSDRISSFSINDRILLDSLNLDRKIGSLDWHPTENIISLGVHNHLFLMHQKKSSSAF